VEAPSAAKPEDFVVGRWGLGQIALARQAYDEALSEFEIAASLQGRLADQLDRAAGPDGRSDEQREAAAESRAIYAEILVAIAYCLRATNQTARAIPILREAETNLEIVLQLYPRLFAPDLFRTLIILGDYLVATQPGEAGVAYRRALTFGPTSVDRWSVARKLAELRNDVQSPGVYRQRPSGTVREVRQGEVLALSMDRRMTGTLQASVQWSDRQVRPSYSAYPPMVQADTNELELGCLYELEDGTLGSVQDVGGHDGAYDRVPYIWMDHYAQNGDKDLYVNLGHIEEINSILIYVISNFRTFGQTTATVTLIGPGADATAIHLDAPPPGSRSCAVARLDREEGILQLKAELRYTKGTQAAVDEMYGWGLSWPGGLHIPSINLP
jgi:uncharacterized protein involved in tellurium resistance